MRKFILLSFLFLSLFWINIIPISASDDISNIKTSTSQLHINNGHILNSVNEEVKLIGICTADYSLVNNTWYTSNWYDWYNIDSLQTLKNWGINTFRIAMTPSEYMNNHETIETYKEFVNLSISMELYTIVEWGYTKNPNDLLSESIDFFSSISKQYSNNPYVIYDICNECYNTTWQDIYDYAQTIIPIILNNSPDAIIMISLPYDDILKNPNIILSPIEKPIPFKNIIYTYHLYTGQSLTYNILNNLLIIKNSGFAVDISEWSGTLSSGTGGFYNVPAEIFADFLNKNNFSWQYFHLSDIQFNNKAYTSSIVVQNKWDNNLPDNILSESGLMFKKTLLNSKSLNNSSTKYCMLREYNENYAFWSSKYKNEISAIYFEYSNYKPKNVIESWDLSINNSNDIIGYLCNKKNTYELHIVPNKNPIYAPEYFSKWLSNFPNLKSIDFENLNTDYTRKAMGLFSGDISLIELDLRNLNFPNADDFNCLFLNCSSLRKIDMSNCNMLSMTCITKSFCNMRNLNELYLGNINPLIFVSFDSTFYKTKTDNLKIYAHDNISSQFFSKISNANIILY